MSAKSQLPSVTAADAVAAAFLAINGLQGNPPGAQVAGVAFLFTVMVDQLGLDPADLLDQSRRRFKHINNAALNKKEAQALSDYVNGELR